MYHSHTYTYSLFALGDFEGSNPFLHLFSTRGSQYYLLEWSQYLGKRRGKGKKGGRGEGGRGEKREGEEERRGGEERRRGGKERREERRGREEREGVKEGRVSRR